MRPIKLIGSGVRQINLIGSGVRPIKLIDYEGRPIKLFGFGKGEVGFIRWLVGSGRKLCISAGPAGFTGKLQDL